MTLIDTGTESNATCERPEKTHSTWLPWIRKGSLTLADQILISGSNFAISVLLTRWLLPAEFGAYALAFSVFLLLSLLLQALLFEPMAVLGSSRYRENHRAYVGALLRVYALIILPIMAILGLSALVVWQLGTPPGLSGALAGLTLAAPCVLLFWLARRAFYLKLTPAHAAGGALIYCVLVLAGLGVLRWHLLLSPLTAYLLMALAAMVVAIVMLVRLKPSSELAPEWGGLKDVWHQHWTYGRWSLPATLLTWVHKNILYIFVGIYLGLADVGALKAVLVLVHPLTQLTTALSLLLLPYVSTVYGDQGLPGLESPLRKMTWFFVGGAVAFLAFATLFQDSIFSLLYGGNFIQFARLLPLACVAAGLQVAAVPQLIGLRAMQSPSSVFTVTAAGAVVTVMIGAVAIRNFGLAGAIGTYGFANLAQLVATRLVFRKKLRETGVVPTASAYPVPTGLGD